MRSEESVEQSRGPMDKNRIRGLPNRTSEPMIAKSTVIKIRVVMPAIDEVVNQRQGRDKLSVFCEMGVGDHLAGRSEW